MGNCNKSVEHKCKTNETKINKTKINETKINETRTIRAEEFRASNTTDYFILKTIEAREHPYSGLKCTTPNPKRLRWGPKPTRFKK